MKPIKNTPFGNTRQRFDVLRRKIRFGTVYGIIAGLAFAISAWGVDGFLLSRAHAMYPWLKFIPGAVICAAAGALAGWLTTRFDKGILAVIFYLGLSFVFSRLIVALPLEIFPKLVARFDPELGSLLNYTFYDTFSTRFVVAFVWIAIFAIITGILQSPLVEPATFSTSLFGRIVPFLVCAVIMFISGIIVDSLNNEPLRTAVVEMNSTIQFSLDHRGEEVDKALARSMHVSSLRGVQDAIDPQRGLIVRSYDQSLGQIVVLVRFGDSWVDCQTVYNQPSYCKFVTINSP